MKHFTFILGIILLQISVSNFSYGKENHCGNLLEILGENKVSAIFSEQIKNLSNSIHQKNLVAEEEKTIQARILHHGKKTDSVVVIVHGFTGHAGEMSDLAESYFKKGYNVVSVLLPGHGTGPRGILELKLDDVIQYMDKVIPESAMLGNRLELTGFSFGGGLSAILTDRHKNLVSALNLIAPVIGVNEKLDRFIGVLKKSGNSDRLKTFAGQFYAPKYAQSELLTGIVENGVAVSKDLVDRLNSLAPLKKPMRVITLAGDSTVDNEQTAIFFGKNAKKDQSNFHELKKDSVDQAHNGMRTSSTVIDFIQDTVPISTEKERRVQGALGIVRTQMSLGKLDSHFANRLNHEIERLARIQSPLEPGLIFNEETILRMALREIPPARNVENKILECLIVMP